MSQSELLTQFYRAYVAWIDDGAPEGIVFTRGNGLCSNLIRFIRGVTDSLCTRRMVGNEMYGQFRTAFAAKDWGFPFNDNDSTYWTESGIYQCHLNQDRIKWARDHAA
jgi:hypothetical protein